MRPTLTDANVLYPSLLRNLLMYLATAGACELRWTDQIHEEWLLTVRKMLSSLKNPPMNPDGLRAALERLALPQAAKRLSHLLTHEDTP